MIREVIVVEGKADTQAIKRAVQADTLETGGSAISEEIIEQIRQIQQKRGVIIFTDPDFPGEKIRKTISEKVPGCKHAFITPEEGQGKRNLGVENADPETIRRALADVKTEVPDGEVQIDYHRLVDAGLVGGPGSREKRTLLGKILGIGYANGAQLHKRLHLFQISEEEFERALKEVEHQLTDERRQRRGD